MDEHIPSAITVALKMREVDVLTVQADGRDGKLIRLCWTGPLSWSA
jgi:hypothetical protein